MCTARELGYIPKWLLTASTTKFGRRESLRVICLPGYPGMKILSYNPAPREKRDLNLPVIFLDVTLCDNTLVISHVLRSDSLEEREGFFIFTGNIFVPSFSQL